MTGPSKLSTKSLPMRTPIISWRPSSLSPFMRQNRIGKASEVVKLDSTSPRGQPEVRLSIALVNSLEPHHSASQTVLWRATKYSPARRNIVRGALERADFVLRGQLTRGEVAKRGKSRSSGDQWLRRNFAIKLKFQVKTNDVILITVD